MPEKSIKSFCPFCNKSVELVEAGAYAKCINPDCCICNKVITINGWPTVTKYKQHCSNCRVNILYDKTIYPIKNGGILCEICVNKDISIYKVKNTKKSNTCVEDNIHNVMLLISRMEEGTSYTIEKESMALIEFLNLEDFQGF